VAFVFKEKGTVFMKKIIHVVLVIFYFLPVIFYKNAQAAALSSFSALSAEADPHSGSANFGFNIEVAPGRGGVQPNLQVGYNSSEPNGLFGVGWNLELGSIKRAVKKGVLNYDNTDLFILSQNGGVQEIVLDASTGFYRSKIEGSFLKIERISNNWVVTDKKGNKYYFGQTQDTQEFDPANVTKISKWCLSRVEDVFGNYMTYEYVRDENILYPSKINYTGHTPTNNLPYAYISFEKEVRPDSADSYTYGYRTRMNYRINRINVYAQNNLLRKYQINYTLSSVTNRSLLTSVVQYGSDGTSTLPPMKFSYQNTSDNLSNSYQVVPFTNQSGGGDHLWNYRYDTSYDHGHDTYGPCPPTDMCYGVNWGPSTTYGNTDGSFSMSSGQDVAHHFWTYVFVNQAKTLTVPIQAVEVPYGVYLNGDYSHSVGNTWNLKQGYNLIEITMYHQHQSINFNLNFPLASPLNVDYMGSTQAITPQFSGDFNSDGFTDIANYNSVSKKFTVSLSNGANFVPAADWLSLTLDLQNKDKILPGDFNGDGRTDVAVYLASSRVINVYFSNGTTLVPASPLTWNTGLIADHQFYAVDFDNDGKTDICDLVPVSSSLYADIIINKGDRFEFKNRIGLGSATDPFSPAEINGDGRVDFIAFYKSSGTWLLKQNVGDPSKEFLTLDIINNFGTGFQSVLADFNSDGLTDIGYFDSSQGKIIYRLSIGTTISPVNKELPIVFSQRDVNTSIQYGDFNGDTVPDYIASGFTGLSEIAYSGGRASDLLFATENGLGGISNINYGSVLKFPNTFLPFPIQVVRSVKVSDSLGQAYVTQYSYEKGLWDIEEREFRGFGLVKVIDPDGHHAETEYLQDDIYKGRVKEERTYDVNNNLFSKVVYTWSEPQTIAPNVSFVFLKRKDNFVYDGNTTGRRTAEEYIYGETPQFGNMTKTIQWGEVDLSTGADMGADTRTLETQYVSNTAKWIIGLPTQVTIKNNAGTLVRKSWFYYDNLANAATPILGLLTQKENWLSDVVGTVNAKTKYSYDAYGNLKTTTDARNNVTLVSYDSALNLFPISTTNVLNHQLFNEYYGINGISLNSGDGYKGLWGQLKSTTDPNAQKGMRTYDVFGRPTASVSPVDSIAYPTSKMEYGLGNPLSLLVSRQRIKSGETATIDSFDCYDGLGRLVLNKRRAPTAGQFVVSGLTEYNSRGLAEKQYIPYFTDKPINIAEIIDRTRPRTFTEYDPMGRVIKVTHPDGTYSSLSYSDWTSISIDENGHKQESDFDAYGRLIEKREYTGADGRSPNYPFAAYSLYATTKYKYDSEGNLTETRDAKSNVTTIVYDNLGRKIQMTDPDMGTWKYEYDLNGNLVKQIDAKGKAIYFTYDALNRLTNKTDQGNLNVNYTYDDAATILSKGRLTKAAYQGGNNTTFQYDKLGRETQSQKQIDQLVYNVKRDYNDLNNLGAINYPDSTQLYYQYDSAGQILAVANDQTLLPSSGTTGDDPTITPIKSIEAPYTHYKFNDNQSTTTVLDGGTGANDGMASVNTSQLATVGKLNGALHFDGVSQKVNLNNLLADIRTDTVGTVSFWLKPETNYGAIFTLSDADQNAFYLIHMTSNGNIFLNNRSNSTLNYNATSNSVVTLNTWSLITIVQDGIGIKMYKNGVPETLTYALNYNLNTWFAQSGGTSLDTARLANRSIQNQGESVFFKGAMDDFRYYKRALTAEEVKAIYKNGSGTEDDVITYTSQ
jgi:YD repeat-containing protein